MKIKEVRMILLMIMLLTTLIAGSALAGEGDFTGSWEGNILIGANQLGIKLDLKLDGEGNLTGTVDIPAQGAMGLPLVGFQVTGNEAQFSIANLPGNPTFAGVLSGDVIEGSFTQSGQTFPFKVERVATEKTAPEEPDYATGSYPVKEKEVEIPVAGGNLKGTLALPEGVQGEVPAVILISGSGPTDRDGNSRIIPQRIDTIKEIAHYLISRGIVTLRYDKRGIAASSDLMATETPAFSSYKDDVLQAIDFMKASDDFKMKGLYLVGHSEGATLAAMASDESDDLAGIVLISGPGFKQADVLRKQVKNIGAAEEEQGAPEGLQEEMLQALEDVYKAVQNDTTFDFSSYDIPQKYASLYLSLYNQKEFAKGWLETDPVTYLEGIQIPVCIIQGTNDGRVTKEDARNLAGAVPEEYRELHLIEGVNHFLKKAPSGMINPDQRIAEEVLEIVYNFIGE